MVEGDVLRARFGTRVRALLARTGLTSDDLAALSNLPLPRVEKILEGSYVGITIMDMDVIAHVLQTSLYSLLVPLEA